MPERVERALEAAVRRLLGPLVRILLSHGMSYGKFAELARRSYVEEGLAQLERSGKRPTISAVSALTGLTRKEAKRLNELDDESGSGSEERYNRAIRVISGWTSDREFLDKQAQPAALPLEGESGSFHALVKRYSGDIPPSTMLAVLEASETLARSGEKVTLKEHAYIPKNTPLDKIEILGRDVAELVSTIGHNIDSPPNDPRFQRKVSNVLLRREELEAFRALSNERSQALLEEYHAWLSAREVEPGSEDDAVYVAVGIYYSEDTDPEEHL